MGVLGWVYLLVYEDIYMRGSAVLGEGVAAATSSGLPVFED